MYKKFMDLSIKYKLMFSFGIILIIFLGISGSQVYIGRQSINQFTAAYNEYAAPAQDVAKAYAYLNKAAAQVEEVLLLTDSGEKLAAAKHAQESLKQAKDLAGAVGAAIKDEEIVTLFNAAKADFDVYAKIDNQKISLTVYNNSTLIVIEPSSPMF